MGCTPKRASSAGIVVGHLDHLLPAIRNKNPRALGRGGLPRGSTQVRQRILSHRLHPPPHSEAITGLARSPILSPGGNLRDPLPGGFPGRPVKRAFSQRPPLSGTFAGRYSSRSTHCHADLYTYYNQFAAIVNPSTQHTTGGAKSQSGGFLLSINQDATLSA